MEEILTPDPTIKRVKKARLTSSAYMEVIYFETELVGGEERVSKVHKTCKWDVHEDLKVAYGRLKFHLAMLCKIVNEDATREHPVMGELLVTSFIVGGDGETAGVTIVGRRSLDNGKVLNLATPFTRFEDENCPYAFGQDLAAEIDVCVYEVGLYLNGKCAPIETDMLTQGSLFEPSEGLVKNDMDFGDGTDHMDLLDADEELTPF